MKNREKAVHYQFEKNDNFGNLVLTTTVTFGTLKEKRNEFWLHDLC